MLAAFSHPPAAAVASASAQQRASPAQVVRRSEVRHEVGVGGAPQQQAAQHQAAQSPMQPPRQPPRPGMGYAAGPATGYYRESEGLGESEAFSV